MPFPDDRGRREIAVAERPLMGVGGGVRGGVSHGTFCSSDASIEPFASGDRGVGNDIGAPVGSVLVLTLVSSGGGGSCDVEVSAIKVVTGAGERLAKGSSSSKSDGGELRSVFAVGGRVSGIEGIGIAGGNRSVDVVESERNLEPDVGVVGVMTPSAAMADWKKGGTRMACNERRFLGITDSLAVADLIWGR